MYDTLCVHIIIHRDVQVYVHDLFIGMYDCISVTKIQNYIKGRLNKIYWLRAQPCSLNSMFHAHLY